MSRTLPQPEGTAAVAACGINLAVCGTFHYGRYVRYLNAAGVLNRFYYSHKRSTNAATLGLDRDRAVNLPAKEYLTHLHLRAISHRLGNVAFPLYQDLWERQVVRRWADCDLLHTMLHGTRGRVIDHAKRRGAAVLGEPVNSHPAFVQELLREEHDRLGLPDRTVRGLNTGLQRTVEEAAACDRLLTPSQFVARSYIERGIPVERVRRFCSGVPISRGSVPGSGRTMACFVCCAWPNSRCGRGMSISCGLGKC